MKCIGVSGVVQSCPYQRHSPQPPGLHQSHGVQQLLQRRSQRAQVSQSSWSGSRNHPWTAWWRPCHYHSTHSRGRWRYKQEHPISQMSTVPYNCSYQQLRQILLSYWNFKYHKWLLTSQLQNTQTPTFKIKSWAWYLRRLDGDAAFLLIFPCVGETGLSSTRRGDDTSLRHKRVGQGWLSVVYVRNHGHVTDVSLLVHDGTDLVDGKVHLSWWGGGRS